jgi:hypothetical protein
MATNNLTSTIINSVKSFNILQVRDIASGGIYYVFERSKNDELEPFLTGVLVGATSRLVAHVTIDTTGIIPYLRDIKIPFVDSYIVSENSLKSIKNIAKYLIEAPTYLLLTYMYEHPRSLVKEGAFLKAFSMTSVAQFTNYFLTFNQPDDDTIRVEEIINVESGQKQSWYEYFFGKTDPPIKKEDLILPPGFEYIPPLKTDTLRR